MTLKMTVNCVECDAEITKQMLYAGPDSEAAVNVWDFAQSSWECQNCGHTSCIGDIDMMDREDL